MEPTFKSIPEGGFFDRHPILVPATAFFICWIPYLAVFLRKGIAFGDLGGAYLIGDPAYWILFVIQLGICVISHSLTIRTIVRLYAPRWLIWGSIAFYSLSPAWGLMTAADIRHPLFAAVFCVFTSSCTFALYSKNASKWLWVQLAGGALSVCLLRAEGIWIIIPTLVFVMIFKSAQWWAMDKSRSPLKRATAHFAHLTSMKGSAKKKEEALFSDVCAAFLVLSAVGLMYLLTYCAGWALPLGEPSYGAFGTGGTNSMGHFYQGFPFGNLTGTEDVGGIIPFAAISGNSIFQQTALSIAQLIFSFQCLPFENITFSWVFYIAFFCAFLALAIAISFGWRPASKGFKGDSCKTIDETLHVRFRFDFRPLILSLSMVIIIVTIVFVPSDATLRYMMPVLAAQPMFFGAIFASLRDQKPK